MDDLFSLTSLTPVSSRPSSPMPVDSVVSQEPTAPQGPQPPQEQSESEVSAPIVRHFRSPSRELSYFDPVPVPQRQVPATSHEDAPPTQHNTMEPQVETPQIVSRPQLPADPPTVPSDPDVNSLARKDSWSFTDRAMASLAADPLDLHPFSTARQTQTSSFCHFSFPPPSFSAPPPASTSHVLPPPPPPPPPSRPPEIPSTPESRRPLDVARSLRRRATQNGDGASTSGGHSSRFPGLLSPTTTPPRARVLSSPSGMIYPPVPTALRRIATTPMPQTSSSTATGRGTGMMAPQVTTTPSTTTSTSQPTGLAPQPTAAARPTAIPQPTAASQPPTASQPPATPQPPAIPQPAATSQSTTTTPSTTTSSETPPLTTALPTTTPAPTSIPLSTPQPAATLNHESRTPSVSLSSSTPPAPAEPGPSQPFRVRILDFNQR